MPRDAQGIYSPPIGTKGVPNTPIKSAPYNAYVDDQTNLANEPRPVAVGGTGGSTAQGARDALGITTLLDGKVARAGDRMTGSLSSKIVEHGNKASVTEVFTYADGNTHTVTVAGNLIIDPQGLSEGAVMQINCFYQSGSISVAGTTLWELGAGGKNTNFGELGITLVANTPYRIYLEIVGGVRTGVFQ